MDATVLYRLYGGLLVDVQIVRRVGCTMPGRSRLLCKCAGSMSSQGMLSRRRISPPFKAREILNIKGLRVTRGRIKCSNTEEPYEYDTDGEETHKFELLPDVARGRVKSLSKSITQSAKELLPPMIPLVAETMATSVLISFLIGIVLSLDFVKLIKSHQTLLKVFQIDGFQFHQTITGSFTFVFLVSAAITALLGCMCIPFLRKLKAYQIFRKEGPSAHFSKVGTPTMGGLIFIPVGVTIAAVATHFASGQLNGLIAATLLFGAIGLLDDILGLIRKHNYGLPGLCKFCLQVFAGIWFYFWCESANLPTPFGVKTVVLLPLPFQHWNLGNWYLPFTAFCFASMSNGVNLTDGLDGLATGTAAAAFLGMALAVIHIYPDVAIFGVSMAGACVGFLVHNRHKAAVFMGDTGSLALGGALAAMAASTGMFLPLLICSGIFFVETVSVVLQVSYKRCTKKLTGVTKKLFRMAPIHHHFELGGVKEPTIVAAAHLISCLLALLGGYVGFKILGIGVAAM